MTTTATDKAAPEVQGVPITMSEKAAAEVRRYISQQEADGVKEKIYLRMAVKGGGCSGFKYGLDLDTVIRQDKDEVFEIHGVPIVVDRRSLMYLQGASVEYYDELNRRGFLINNPNARTHCGCGSSFSM
jgi:iron-sulfur cluster assembly protein